MKSSIAYATAAAFILTMAALWLAGCGGSSDDNSAPENQNTGNKANTGSTGSDILTEFESADGPVDVQVTEKVSGFTAADIEGNRITLSDYKGKVVLLDFWASWCPPCEREVPYMKEVYNKYRKEGFEIIGVSLDTDKDDLRAFLKKNDIKWTQVFTGQGWYTPLVVHYSVGEIPEIWLIGKDGKLITKEARGEYLEPLVKQALKQEVE